MALNQTVQPDSSQPAIGSRPGLSWRRLAVVAAVSAVCFVAGFYLGVYALIAWAGFGDLHGWLFLIVTVPLGSLLAGLGAATAGPSTSKLLGPAVAATLLTAAVVTAGLIALSAGFALAISIGGIASFLAAALTVYVVSGRNKAGRLSESAPNL
ncbi:MAG: hypothetical protein WB239_00915 [Acidimicrobiia bacterium]